MGSRGMGSMTSGTVGGYPYKELRRTPSTSAIYETLRRSKELRESLTRPSSRLSMDEKIRDSVSLVLRLVNTCGFYNKFFTLTSFVKTVIFYIRRDINLFHVKEDRTLIKKQTRIFRQETTNIKNCILNVWALFQMPLSVRTVSGYAKKPTWFPPKFFCFEKD